MGVLPITENMKASYDVIAQRSNGKIVVIHESNSKGMKSVYENESEFEKDKSLRGVRAVILESING